MSIATAHHPSDTDLMHDLGAGGAHNEENDPGC